MAGSSASGNAVGLFAWLALFLGVVVHRYSTDVPVATRYVDHARPTPAATAAAAAPPAPLAPADWFASPPHVYDPSNRAVLLYSIPLPGHLNPLLIQGVELARRGWHVYIATTEHRRHMVTEHIARHFKPTAGSSGTVEFLSLHPCDRPYSSASVAAADGATVTAAEEAAEAAADDSAWLPDESVATDSQGLLSLNGTFWAQQSAEASFPVSVAAITETLGSLHTCLYRGLRDAMLSRFAVGVKGVSESHAGNGTGVLLPPNTVPSWHPHGRTVATQRYRFPALLVVDFFSQAGMDVARQLRVPFSVNNADLMYVLSPHILPPHDTEPGMFTGKSMHAMGDAFAERAVYPVVRVLLMHLLLVPAQEKVLNTARAHNLLPPMDVARHLCGRLIVVNTALGLEFPRPMPPIVFLSGPMIAEEPLLPGASDSALDWISAGPDLPVVFVSFGTLVGLDARQLGALVDGLRHTGDGAPTYRVIWKLKHYKTVLSAESLAAVEDAVRRKQLLLTQWVPSQLRLLDDARVRVFLSHCGINSAHESAHYQTPMLCIPFFADQIDMAWRVLDAGMGLQLNKANFTGAEVRDALNRIVTGTSFAANARRVSRLVRHTPGPKGTADLLETVIEFGTAHLQSPEMQFGAIQYYGLDVAATYVLIAVALRYVCRTYCCTGRGAADSALAAPAPVAAADNSGRRSGASSPSYVSPQHSPNAPHSPHSPYTNGNGTAPPAASNSSVYYRQTAAGSGAEHVRYR